MQRFLRRKKTAEAGAVFASLYRFQGNSRGVPDGRLRAEND